jgi:L-amino acid N-acyltransferase YncA
VLVRDAVESDASAISLLWAELLTGPGASGGDGADRSPERVVARSVTATRDDVASRIVVAEAEGVVVGCAYLRTGLVSPVHAERVVHVSHLHVAPDQHGADHALLESAVAWAEDRGVDTVVAATAASDRESNRVLARLGLAQVAVLRSASVTALRARLPHDPSAAARAGLRGGRSVSQVVAARRSQRRARTRQLLI